jgi:hypothetical protein
MFKLKVLYIINKFSKPKYQTWAYIFIWSCKQKIIVIKRLRIKLVVWFLTTKCQETLVNWFQIKMCDTTLERCSLRLITWSWKLLNESLHKEVMNVWRTMCSTGINLDLKHGLWGNLGGLSSRQQCDHVFPKKLGPNTCFFWLGISFNPFFP